MVPEGAGPWPDHSSPPLDAQVWVEAWDDLVPGYRRRRFTSAEEADAAFRMLRGRGYSVMIEECAGE
jgi:hypothetical protein